MLWSDTYFDSTLDFEFEPPKRLFAEKKVNVWQIDCDDDENCVFVFDGRQMKVERTKCRPNEKPRIDVYRKEEQPLPARTVENLESVPSESSKKSTIQKIESSAQNQMPVAGQDKKPVAREDQKPVAGQDKKPVPGQDKKPVAREDQKPVAGQDKKPVARQDQKPVAGQDKKPMARQDQKPVARQDKKPVARQDEKPVAGQGKKPVARQDQKPVPRQGFSQTLPYRQRPLVRHTIVRPKMISHHKSFPEHKLQQADFTFIKSLNSFVKRDKSDITVLLDFLEKMGKTRLNAFLERESIDSGFPGLMDQIQFSLLRLQDEIKLLSVVLSQVLEISVAMWEFDILQQEESDAVDECF